MMDEQKIKKLFMVIDNGGNGSADPHYTPNEAWIHNTEIQEASEDLDFETWSDGGGFHYDVLNVPEERTLESLGVGDCAG